MSPLSEIVRTATAFPSKVGVKGRILILAAILGVVFLLLQSGDEPPPEPDNPPRTDAPPAADNPDRRTGRHIPRPRGEPGHHPGKPHADGTYRTPAPYGAQSSDWAGGYRLGPAGEDQTQNHKQTPDAYRHQDQNATPSDSRSPCAQSQPAAPAPYPAPPAHTDPPPESYSFRPLKKSPGAQGRWQGPYQRPEQRLERHPQDPGSSSPPPQWGSTPPSQRMYPSLHPHPDRRLSTRTIEPLRRTNC